jgi:hypothetical protein
LIINSSATEPTSRVHVRDDVFWICSLRMNVPPYCSLPAPGDVGTIDVVTRTSESTQPAPNVDGFGDGLAVCGVVEAVGLIVGVAGTVADADGPDGSDVDDDGADGAVDEASGLACAPRELPALDRLDPHEYTISRMIRSNPPSTIARRRQ